MNQHASGDQSLGEPKPGTPEAVRPVPGVGAEPGATVVLQVSAALRELAVSAGLARAGNAIQMPADQYMAAASRLAKEWSKVLPTLIAMQRARQAGAERPAGITPEVLDALLVHDHECRSARDRAHAKEAARRQEPHALPAPGDPDPDVSEEIPW
ncbi:MAG: hypothetical protein ACYCRH_03480 [Acidiferrobacteraceae bacterium]